MKIKMLATKLGVNDGQIYPSTFEKGETYEVGPDLADAFISDGCAEEVTEKTKEDGNKAKRPHANKAKKTEEDK